MKELITEQYKQMLWKDDEGSDFLLLKYCEVYRCSEDTLKLVVFASKNLNENVVQLRKAGVILKEWATDD